MSTSKTHPNAATPEARPPNRRRRRWIVFLLLVALLVVGTGWWYMTRVPGLDVRASLRAHESVVLSVAFSPDNAILATAGDQGTLRVFDLATGERIVERRHPRQVLSVAFSPDGRTLATGCSDAKVRFWDVATWQVRAEVSPNVSVLRLAFSPAGDALAFTTGSEANGVHLYRLSDDRIDTFSVGTPPGYAWSLAYSPDSKFVAWANVSGLGAWDTVAGEFTNAFLSSQPRARCVAFSPDAAILAVGHDGGAISLLACPPDNGEAVFETGNDRISAVAFLPDGKRLAALGVKPQGVWMKNVPGLEDLLDSTGLHLGPSRAVELWDTQDGGKLIARASVDAHSMALSPDGKTLAAGLRDGKVLLFDMPED